MSHNALSRWLSPIMAFCLSFIIITTLAPVTGIQVERQIDFWILWLLTMVILALPICYLEIALAKRSKTTALHALSSLTRDADASSKWRVVGWLAVIFIPFLAGAILNNAAQLLMVYAVPRFESNLLFVGLAILAVVISFIPRGIIVLLTALGVISSLVFANVIGTALPEWQVTPLELSEWGHATILALVASGLGLGLYSQSNLSTIQSEDVATKTALPVWIAQLFAVIAFGFFAIRTEIPAVAFILAVLAGSALLLQMAREQLAQRQTSVIVQWVILLVALFIWAIPQTSVVFNHVIVLWGLIICFIYAIFAGWIMKISHLRKSMNFSHEIFYNLWRIAVRIILPLGIIMAIIAYLGQWI
ncbi:hypothetical protein B9T31_04890 [Acinetobacter sp. ANC 4558]|uniref:hypothetical protein n=1 Tax=Acinetobacter sp. ANC 4558 TaxID=1977876 RepID=UPI000A34DC13|nr:hypothetical protein [Acinetobacter sp. ANC 4558]OTG86955.1 hypothetical protein B9T31_04890 [Acinetobacter sp. ANC 4558]